MLQMDADHGNLLAIPRAIQEARWAPSLRIVDHADRAVTYPLDLAAQDSKNKGRFGTYLPWPVTATIPRADALWVGGACVCARARCGGGRGEGMLRWAGGAGRAVEG